MKHILLYRFYLFTFAFLLLGGRYDTLAGVNSKSQPKICRHHHYSGFHLSEKT